jgi:cytochrome P450
MSDSRLSQVWSATAIVIGVCGGALLFYQLTKPKSKKGEVPYVAGYPVIDNLIDMLPDTMLERMDMHQKTYGSVFKMRMFSQKFIHFSDTQLCREVLQKRPKTFIRGRVLEDMALRLRYLPYGVFHANDATTWNKVRKTTSPAFSKQNLTNMSRDFLVEALKFARQLDEFASRNEEIDMLKAIISYTVGVISRVAFGNDQVDYFFGQQFYADVRTTFAVLLDSAMFPFPRWVWTLTPNYRNELAAIEADKRFTAACQQVIDIKRSQHRQMSEDEKKQTHSLIDIMIRQDESHDAEVLANVKTFYLAGSDTTSMSIGWAVYLLAQHPEAVARMRAELKEFFAQDLLGARSAQEISEAINGLVYTNAVLKEAIRMYPAGPAIFLDYVPGEEPITLSNGVVVPADTTVIVNLWQCLMDEANFSDAKRFLPERWLTEDKAQLARMDHAFLGFGAGARVCPGMNLAMGEGVAALAAMFHYFDVTLCCPAEEVRAQFKFTLQPSKLPVRLTRRAGVTVPAAGAVA